MLAMETSTKGSGTASSMCHVDVASKSGPTAVGTMDSGDTAAKMVTAV